MSIKNMNLQVITYDSLRPGSKLDKAYPGDSCYDISAALGTKAVCLEPMDRITINTGIKLNLPPGIEATIRSRSGLAAKHGIFVLNSPGTIDSGYTGEIKVILMNLGKHKYYIKENERIAQIFFSKINEFKVTDSNGWEALPRFSSRISLGLGSSDNS